MKINSSKADINKIIKLVVVKSMIAIGTLSTNRSKVAIRPTV
jgi:hypothetical protein